MVEICRRKSLIPKDFLALFLIDTATTRTSCLGHVCAHVRACVRAYVIGV
ncbi:hypothetical protein [Streptococcus salivarius]|nr:hypothetical protein [Streptococcus salivarius]